MHFPASLPSAQLMQPMCIPLHAYSYLPSVIRLYVFEFVICGLLALNREKVHDEWWVVPCDILS